MQSPQKSNRNEAVLLIRGVRQQIGPALKPVSDPATRRTGEQLDASLAAIEGRIYQVRNQSRQDPLNYPIMLNNKLAALAGVVESAEAAPTQQDYAVFNDLSQQLDRELAALEQLLDRELPALNVMLERAHIPAVERRAQGAVEQGSSGKESADDDDEG